MLKIPFRRRKRFWIFSGLLVAVIALGFWHVWRTPTPLPLPTDEEMIAHFQSSGDATPNKKKILEKDKYAV